MLTWFRPRRNTRIFRYWNGQRWTGIDPIQAYRELSAHPEFDFESIGVRVEEGDLEAIQILCKTVQEVFHVTSWKETADGKRESGLSIEEQILLITRYCEWISDVKKNIALSPTPRPPMVPETSVESTTNSFADFGSTSVAPEPARPGTSSAEPQPQTQP